MKKENTDRMLANLGISHETTQKLQKKTLLHKKIQLKQT